MDWFSANEEGVAWPSYVDFLSTFIFILIIFLGSILYLMSNGVRQERFVKDSKSSRGDFGRIGIDPIQGRLQETIPLYRQLQFPVGCPGKPDCPADIPDSARKKLIEVANVIGERHQACTRIIVRGQADAQKYANDEFGNYELSNRRASMILRMLYKCDQCSPAFKLMRGKLTLAGVGDTLAVGESLDDPNDRTVNLIIDYSGDSVR